MCHQSWWLWICVCEEWNQQCNPTHCVFCMKVSLHRDGKSFDCQSNNQQRNEKDCVVRQGQSELKPISVISIWVLLHISYSDRLIVWLLLVYSNFVTLQEMIVQSDKMMREQSVNNNNNNSRVAVSPPVAVAAPDHQQSPSSSCLTTSNGGALLYRPSAAAAAAAAALSMAGAFPFGPFGTLNGLGGLGGLRMLANQSSMSFQAGMLGIGRPNLSSLLPFGIHHPSGSVNSRPSAYFPYANPPQFQQQQQQQQQHHHQQQQQQQPTMLQKQQLPSPACGSASGGGGNSGGGTERSGERGSSGLLPHTPPTSPSLDENTDLNKTGQCHHQAYMLFNNKQGRLLHFFFFFFFLNVRVILEFQGLQVETDFQLAAMMFVWKPTSMNYWIV